MTVNRFFVLALMLLAGGCGGPFRYPATDPGLALTAVQRPQDAADRWGPYSIEPTDSTGFEFADGMLRIVVIPMQGRFSTTIDNTTEHSIRLIWEQAAYVGPDGQSSGIVPGSMRWGEIGSVAPPAQVIPAGSRATAVALPIINAVTSTQRIMPFFDRTATCDDMRDRSIRLLLPLEIEGQLHEYTLSFETVSPARVEYGNMGVDGVLRNELSRDPC